MINAAECCRSAEQKAADYFKSLDQQIVNKNYVQTLTKDFQSWKYNHIHHHSWLSCFGRNKNLTLGIITVISNGLITPAIWTITWTEASPIFSCAIWAKPWARPTPRHGSGVWWTI